MEPKEIRAVHRRNLKEVLGKLGLLQALEGGELACEVCSRTITLDNLGTIFKKGGQIHVCCNQSDCLAKTLAPAEGAEA